MPFYFLLPSKVHTNTILFLTSKPIVEEENSDRHTNDTQDDKVNTLLTKQVTNFKFKWPKAMNQFINQVQVLQLFPSPTSYPKRKQIGLSQAYPRGEGNSQ